ncbi:hypothetical protein HDU98_011251 [Podochytrium sp. JEL0797]|nr:hypothetical protein HDU98_011251 [Podochytrium sp. JEL0797]
MSIDPEPFDIQTEASLLAALAAYPVDEDGDSFIDTFAECVRHNEVANLGLLIGFLLKDHPLLATEFALFASKTEEYVALLDEYYANYYAEVKDALAAQPHPTPMNPDEEMAEADDEDQEPAMQEKTTPIPQPNPPTVPALPTLSQPLKTLLRAIATTPCVAGFTPLHAASANNHLPLLALFFINSNALVLPSDLDVTPTTAEDGGSPLHWACLNGHLEVVKTMVERGANVGKRNKEGMSALGLAEMMGRDRLVNWIVENCDVGLDDDSNLADAMDAKADMAGSSSTSA